MLRLSASYTVGMIQKGIRDLSSSSGFEDSGFCGCRLNSLSSSAQVSRIEGKGRVWCCSGMSLSSGAQALDVGPLSPGNVLDQPIRGRARDL